MFRDLDFYRFTKNRILVNLILFYLMKLGEIGIKLMERADTKVESWILNPGRQMYGLR